MTVEQIILNSTRTELLFAIDLKTRDILAQGYVSGGKTFSCTPQAQQNALELMVNSGVSFPYGICTKDNTDSIEFLDTAELNIFCSGLLAHVRDTIDTGRELKISAQAAVSLDALTVIHNTNCAR